MTDQEKIELATRYAVLCHQEAALFKPWDEAIKAKKSKTPEAQELHIRWWKVLLEAVEVKKELADKLDPEGVLP